MKHHIDPKIDCVFKALLGAEENCNLLINFLNSILSKDLSVPIVWVDILNPYNDKEFINDKLSVVDVKAKDSQERIYQIEIQMSINRYLPERIIYNWTDIYSQQLQSGHDYHQLMPTYSIWLMAENVVKGDDSYLHQYKLSDGNGNVLVEHGGIWILELKKFNDKAIESDKQIWLKFFKDGEALDEEKLPEWMNTKEMRQAMGTLKLFSEKEMNYHAYQARQNFFREQRTIQWEIEQVREEKQAALKVIEEALKIKEAALQEKNAALQEKDAALQERDAVLKENERLRALLGKH